MVYKANIIHNIHYVLLHNKTSKVIFRGIDSLCEYMLPGSVNGVQQVWLVKVLTLYLRIAYTYLIFEERSFIDCLPASILMSDRHQDTKR